MPIKHLDPSDARYKHKATSIKRYGCTTCGAERVTYDTAAPFCDTCQKYMAYKSSISEREVLEIKNTVKEPSESEEPTSRKKGRKARFTEGLVVHGVHGTVRPRFGGPDLKILINMDANAFTKGIVMMKWGSVEFTSSVNEIDRAFRPLDPTPRIAQVEGKAPTTIVPTPRRVSFKLGPVEVEGGKNPIAFASMIATFSCSGQRADFNLGDICAVLAKAL